MTIQGHERRNQRVAAGVAVVFLLSAPGFSTTPTYAADTNVKTNEAVVSAYRLKLEEPPKMTFMVKVLGNDFASFYIAYQLANAKAGEPPMTTPAIVIDPKDIRKQYGDYLAGSKLLNTEALSPGIDYVYWLVGTYRDTAKKFYISPKGTFSTEPVKGLKEGVLTAPAWQPNKDRTTVIFDAAIGKPKEEGVGYMEYGTNPNRLDRKTREKSFDKVANVSYSAEEDLLQPGATYYYRFVADYLDGSTARGGALSIKVANISSKKENPCEGRALPAPYQVATRLSEDTAVVCAIAELAPSVNKGSGIDGQLVCPEAFPRNLNTKQLDFTIPKANIPVSIERQGVGFWRSTADVRFDDWMVWAQQGQEGQQDPVRQGSQKYQATNWSPQTQTLVVWIYCSDKWSAPGTFK